MPADHPKPKPTGAQLYKQWMAGDTFFGIAYKAKFALTENMIEDTIQAYLKRRDKRERRVAR